MDSTTYRFIGPGEQPFEEPEHARPFKVRSGDTFTIAKPSVALQQKLDALLRCKHIEIVKSKEPKEKPKR